MWAKKKKKRKQTRDTEPHKSREHLCHVRYKRKAEVDASLEHSPNYKNSRKIKKCTKIAQTCYDEIPQNWLPIMILQVIDGKINTSIYMNTKTEPNTIGKALRLKGTNKKKKDQYAQYGWSWFVSSAIHLFHPKRGPPRQVKIRRNQTLAQLPKCRSQLCWDDTENNFGHK